jgi:hypothetical protein
MAWGWKVNNLRHEVLLWFRSQSVHRPSRGYSQPSIASAAYWRTLARMCQHYSPVSYC